jgi:dTDP-4-dehydrorhamnose 3,5-epimerase
MEFDKNIEGIEGLVVITPRVFEDGRGSFKETYNEEKFEQNGINIKWLQDNESQSSKGVFRGLHWQVEPCAQDKLVRVVQGAVLDVAVDIRKDSPTYKKYTLVKLTPDNHRIFFLPKGFAHGFLALEDGTRFVYKVGGSLYDKDSERSMRWDDPDIGIDFELEEWGIEELILSEKDANAPFLKDIPDEDLF